LPGIATRLDDAKLFEAEGFFDYIEKMSFVGMNFDASVPGGTGAVAANRVDDFGEDRAQVAIAERKNGVEMHGCPALRHQAANHTRGRFLFEELRRKLIYRLRCGALSHANQHHAFADRHNVPSFETRRAKVFVRIAPPYFEITAFEAR